VGDEKEVDDPNREYLLKILIKGFLKMTDYIPRQRCKG